MAENLSAWQPEFWAGESLATLTNNLVLGRMIHRDFSPIVAEEGVTVNTRKPASFSANDKGADSDVTVQDASAENIAVTLNTHKEVTFTVRDITRSTSLKSLTATHIVPAMQALSQAIDLDIATKMALYFPYWSGSVGSAATVPDSLTSARKKANEEKWGFDGRQMVVNPEVEEIFLKSATFTSKDYVDGDALQNASLGRKWGFDIFMDQNVGITKTQAAASGYLINGAVSAGASTIVTDTGTGAITAGAKISVGGEQYAVVSVTGTLPAYTITISPKARIAIADNAPITVLGAAGATFTQLPYFKRNAMLMVSRPLALPEPELGIKAAVISDGDFAMRALVSYNANRLGIQVTLDVLYGLAPGDVEVGAHLVY